MNTDIIITKVGDKIELHFRGDVTLVRGWTDHVDELLGRDITIVAYSGEFENPTPQVRMDDKDTLQTPNGEMRELKLTPQLEREMDAFQREWLAMGPIMRGLVDKRIREFIREGKITRKIPQP